MLKYHIQTIEVGSGGAADITFSNIPQDYDDLHVVLSVKAENTDNGLFFKFNNTTANTSWRNLLGYGTATLSQSGGGWLAAGGVRSTTAGTYGSVSVTIPNYKSTTVYKTASVDSISEANESTAYQFLVANLWSDYSAINSITFYLQSGELDQYSSASLYGIKRGADGVTDVVLPASGGTITTSGGYTIHTFTSSGTFTSYTDMSVDYLVIGGGGGGGSHTGGGGGAGGYRTSAGTSGGNTTAEPSLNITAGTGYAVTVGAGGAGAPTNTVKGTSGSNSVLDSITSVGGGGGGSVAINTGLPGGSGGGGSRSTGGEGTSSQGYRGGNTVNVVGGGGGGAGAQGQDTSAPTASNGGAGISSSITGTAVTRAGGGGGAGENGYSNSGSGGAGGGGNGSNTSGATAGVVNTGSGGGGGGYLSGTPYAGGAGASGIVIIRYLTPA